MADPKHLVRTSKMDPARGMHIRHPMQRDAEVFWTPLSNAAGMQRAHLNMACVSPGKSAFPVHFHALQEEFVFVLSGQGTATIGNDTFDIVPGDYLGFPTDGTPHGIRNTGDENLICLMGGERTDTEVATFPELGKVAIQRPGEMLFHDMDDAETRKMSEWVVKD